MGFEDFCGGKLWDLDTIWRTEDPDFTACFQNTILAWLPASFLLLSSPFELGSWLGSKCPRIPFTPLNMIKLLLSLALAVICIVEIVYLDKWHGAETTATDAQYLGESVMIAAYLFSALLLILSLR